MGLATQDLTPDIARRLGLEQEQGIIISGLGPGCPTDEASLQQCDIIEEINRSVVT